VARWNQERADDLVTQAERVCRGAMPLRPYVVTRGQINGQLRTRQGRQPAPSTTSEGHRREHTRPQTHCPAIQRVHRQPGPGRSGQPDDGGSHVHRPPGGGGPGQGIHDPGVDGVLRVVPRLQEHVHPGGIARRPGDPHRLCHVAPGRCAGSRHLDGPDRRRSGGRVAHLSGHHEFQK